MESCGQFDHVIKDSAGLHARPAANFARFVGGLASQVRVAANGKEVDGKSMIALMSLGVPSGGTVHITVSGAEAARETSELETYCAENL